MPQSVYHFSNILKAYPPFKFKDIINYNVTLKYLKDSIRILAFKNINGKSKKVYIFSFYYGV